MSNNKYIEDLIGKFMQAQTSEQEEAMLAEYFRKTKDVPSELEPYKEYFNIFDSQEKKSDGNGIFDKEELDSFITERHYSLWNKRRWLYVAAGIAAMIVFAVVYNFTPSLTLEQKELTVKTTKSVKPTKMVQKTNTLVSGEKVANLDSKQKTTERNRQDKKDNYGKRSIQSKEDFVPVPQPATATEAKRDMASPIEMSLNENLQHIGKSNTEESIAYIKSKGNNLERQVLASRGGLGHRMNTNKNLD